MTREYLKKATLTAQSGASDVHELVQGILNDIEEGGVVGTWLRLDQESDFAEATACGGERRIEGQGFNGQMALALHDDVLPGGPGYVGFSLLLK